MRISQARDLSKPGAHQRQFGHLPTSSCSEDQPWVMTVFQTWGICSPILAEKSCVAPGVSRIPANCLPVEASTLFFLPLPTTQVAAASLTL